MAEQPTDDLQALRERAKELRCLYRIDAIVGEPGQSPERTFQRVLEAVPEGWQHPTTTGARIVYLGRSRVGPGYSPTAPTVSRPIRLWGVEVGRIEISDEAELLEGAEPFLAEEVELLGNIAGRLGTYLERKHGELFGERSPSPENHWRWRQGYAEALAAQVAPERFGPCRVFLGGSTERGDAGPGSDIDLSILCEGTPQQRQDLATWIEGWSRCLAEVALQQTGHPFPRGIVNVDWLEEEPETWRQADLRELPTGGGAAG